MSAPGGGGAQEEAPKDAAEETAESAPEAAAGGPPRDGLAPPRDGAGEGRGGPGGENPGEETGKETGEEPGGDPGVCGGGAQARVAADPRNLWSRLAAVLESARAGRLDAARRQFAGLACHPGLSAPVQAFYAAELARLEAAAGGGGAARINTPADYLSAPVSVLHPPFQRLEPGSAFPAPYPYGMALPALPGPRNGWRFLADAAAQRGGGADWRGRIHVVWLPLGCADARPLLAALAAQGFGGRLALTVLAGDGARAKGLEAAAAGRGALAAEVLDCGLNSAQAAARIARLPQEADQILFLAGEAGLDAGFLRRLAFLASVSDAVVQPLTGPAGPAGADAGTGPGAAVAAAGMAAGGLDSVYAQQAAEREFSGRYPFRSVRGMNFAISGAMLARAGGPDPRFAASAWAAREMLWRAWNAGAYLAPLVVPGLAGHDDRVPGSADEGQFISLCPNHWDRPADGRYEVPKVSVYIPVHNAARYIERAVDSVLAQDVEDLELCLYDDGSADATLTVLAARYGGEPRVRWQSGPNGGIGHASNRALAMARGMYIGQLDSDDCLKPGAVRRLMEHLDAHPDLACAYGSCERVNAQGVYLQDEYSWPVFSREKMMITSIAHHFRMFRRAAFARTAGFREDIANAVDYDIFLKMSETGGFHHIDEMLYQRRWHGANTSKVNEGAQTANTHKVQRAALARLGLARGWELAVPDPAQPRKVTYQRRAGRPMVVFWPDYSRSNPYQRLLYAKAAQGAEICAGPIEAALRLAGEAGTGDGLVFHLHWLNFLFEGLEDPVLARAAVEDFLAKTARFKARGGRLVWTIHNTVSHDLPFAGLEQELAGILCGLADAVHVHAADSVPEIEAAFALPKDKLAVSRHGNYTGAYPDFASREEARAALGIAPGDEVILFTGQLRRYKGVEALVAAFRRILKDRPQALLVVAGVPGFDLLADLEPALSPQERARIRLTGRFLEPMEMQLFFRAADVAAYPYQKILTSGSMLLAMSFGVPVVIPEVGMTRAVLAGADAGCTYAGADDGPDTGADGGRALEAALRQILEADPARRAEMGANARARAAALDWPDFSPVLARALARRGAGPQAAGAARAQEQPA